MQPIVRLRKPGFPNLASQSPSTIRIKRGPNVEPSSVLDPPGSLATPLPPNPTSKLYGVHEGTGRDSARMGVLSESLVDIAVPTDVLEGSETRFERPRCVPLSISRCGGT